MYQRTFPVLKNNNLYVKDSETYNFPHCRCIYENGNKFMIIEVNSGYKHESLKIVSPIYPSYTELIKNYRVNEKDCRFIYNYIIYNDRIKSSL